MNTAVPTPCLGVVVPCYNEAERVAAALHAVLESPWTAEVVVVDDGSTDATAKLVDEVVATDGRVRLLRQPCNLGKGAALRRGFREVTAPYVIVQDADLEYDPTDWGALIEPLLRGDADVVFGSRFHTDRPHRVLYYWHSVGNKLLTTLSNAATNLNLSDMETCSKIFRREVIDGLDLREDRFGFEPEITAKVAAGGWRVYESSVTYRGRTYEEGKKIGWRDGIRAIYCIGRYSRPGERLAGRVNRVPDPVAPDEVDDAQLVALEALEGADEYADWVVSLFEEHVRGRILEVGAGVGTMTRRLAARGSVVAVEPSDASAAALAAATADDERIEVVHGDVGSVPLEPAFDAAVLVNVLEHVRDDVQLLRALRDRLGPGGSLVTFVPAHAWLHSDFDDRIGHQRRYRRAELAEAFTAAGLAIDELRYVNAVGALTWLLGARGLGLAPQPWSVALYQRAVLPLLRSIEDERQPPFGQSLLAIGHPVE